MFAPSIASAKARPTAQRSSQSAPRQLAPTAGAVRADLSARPPMPGIAWDFRRVPTFPPLLTPVQPKLTIGAVDDPLEREADRIADQVMRTPVPAGRASADRPLAVQNAPPFGIQRRCAACEEEIPGADAADDGTLEEQGQEMAVDLGQPVVSAKPEETGTPSPAAPALATRPLAATGGTTGGGRPLDSGVRTFFEQRFGHSFDHVRIHTGAHASASARAVNALAYTVGNAIVFGPGQYEPDTATGQRLLAHELTHVLQQAPSTGRRASPTDNGVQVQTMTTSLLQRWSANGPSDKSTNTIVCDGKGGIRVQIGTANDAGSLPCLLDCLTQHEQSHRSDALAANATVCDSKADGSQVNFGTGEQKPSEIKASQAEIDCLNAKLPGATDTCKPAIRQRITQITAYRDSFK